MDEYICTMLGQLIQTRKKTLFLREMGAILLLGATLHFVGVSYLYASEGFPKHERIAYIFFIGLIQLAVGLLDILASRLVQLDRSSAISVVTVSTILITGYVIMIVPVYPDLSFAFKLAPPSYLLYHWWVSIRLRWWGSIRLRLESPE